MRRKQNLEERRVLWFSSSRTFSAGSFTGPDGRAGRGCERHDLMGTSLVIRSWMDLSMNPARIQEIIETARCKPANCYTRLPRRHGGFFDRDRGCPSS
jgi:hypothetical protein